MSGPVETTLSYDEATVVAMLVAIKTCPAGRQMDSMAAFVKIFVEHLANSAREVELMETREQHPQATARLGEVNDELAEVRQQIQRVSDLAESWTLPNPEGADPNVAIAGRAVLQAIEGTEVDDV